MKIRFTVKIPKGQRKTFAIVKDVTFADGRPRSQETVEDEALTALNRNLKNGLIGLGDAEIQVRTIIKPRLQKQAGLQDKKDAEETVSEHNLAVFRKFWDFLTEKKRNVERKPLKNPVSTRNDLLAALRAIDPLSLTTGTFNDLADALNHLDNKRHRRYAIRLNQLLEYLGREFRLPLAEVAPDDVHFLKWEELQEVLPNLPSDESRLLAQVLFTTGVRLGEAFMLTARKLQSDMSLFVDKQLTHKFETRGLKNNKPHKTVVLPQGKEALIAWCALTEGQRRKLRNTISHQLLEASRKTFPDKERHVSPHDLRHSYAIYLLERRATITEIAFLLGDTEATVRRHYTGYVINDRVVQNINDLLKVS